MMLSIDLNVWSDDSRRWCAAHSWSVCPKAEVFGLEFESEGSGFDLWSWQTKVLKSGYDSSLRGSLEKTIINGCAVSQRVLRKRILIAQWPWVPRIDQTLLSFNGNNDVCQWEQILEREKKPQTKQISMKAKYTYTLW